MANNNKRPPLELDDLTNNLKESSGKGMDAFFPTQPMPKPEKNTEVEESAASPTPPESHIEKTRENKSKTRSNDVTTSSRHDVDHRKWRDIIENTETHNSALRITNDERYEIEDAVNELRRKLKIKSSMNELARLGLLYIIDDFKKNKQESLIVKVKKS